MKLPSLLLAAVLAASAVSLHAEIVSKESARTRYAQLPEPVEVVAFRNLPARFNQATVDVVLTIDASGKPVGISSSKRLPADLTLALYPSLSKWRFKPATDQNGNPVSIQVLLPLKLVDTL